MIYKIEKQDITIDSLKSKLKENPQIKFVSLVAIDLGNNHTDEKIPINVFLEDIESFLKNGVQTDGSSVVLPIIANINNARVDLIPDTDCNWFVDYNYDHILEDINLPVGTLLIPSYLRNNNYYCGSRSILKRATDTFKKELLELLKDYDTIHDELGINYDDISDISITSATELEFWVKSPDTRAEEQKLNISEVLKEQYWKRTVGDVRTAIEEALILLEKFGLNPEMAHKEVGGVPSKLYGSNKFTHIMEQLEIDWKYSTPLQCGDNEWLVRDIIKDCFNRYGLEVSFKAKPIENVAGSGEHHHLGIAIMTKGNKFINLFSSQDMTKHFLNKLGYGALMGVVRHYNIINPFISQTSDAFNRLKPGFEAPICNVVSLGFSPTECTRNRTVLVGLIRDNNNPKATRFEVRSPNPLTNTYLCLASLIMASLDGIKAVLKNDFSIDEIEENFNKKEGEKKFYLLDEYSYRSEDDIFHSFSEEERIKKYGKSPKTVYENIKELENNPLDIFLVNNVFNKNIINSYITGVLDNWIFELENRIVLENIDIIKNMKKIHADDNSLNDDIWQEIENIKNELAISTKTNLSIFEELRNAIKIRDYELTSNLQVKIINKISYIKDLYNKYKLNII